MKQTMGDRVKLRRKELKLTQQELGKAAKLTQPTVSALEKNRAHGSMSTAQLATALKVNPLWLATGSGKMELATDALPKTARRKRQPPAVTSSGGEAQMPEVNEVATPTDAKEAKSLEADNRPVEIENEQDQHRKGPEANNGQAASPAPRDETSRIKFVHCPGSCGGRVRRAINNASLLTVSTHVLDRCDIKDPESLVYTYAEGDAMTPFAADGDIFIFDTGVNSIGGDDVYLLELAGTVRVKRAHVRVDGSVLLADDNPDKRRYPDQEVSAMDMRSLIVVKGRLVLRIG